jgi:AbrB family looped-hinge helix DNA binding protein
MEAVMVDNAKVLAKGQITIPKDFRDVLGVDVGDRVTLIKRADEVVMMNAAIYAMKILQDGMKGEFEKAGIMNDDDVVDVVKEIRGEIEGL